MRETHAAIDRALAAAPDPQRALMVGCGLCTVTVPFHSERDIAIVLDRKQRQGGCIFSGHRICRLAVSQPTGPAAVGEQYLPLKLASYRLGKSERTVLRWARARGAAMRDGGRWLINMAQIRAAPA